MPNRLLIFIKNPVLGRCKTRLADSVGDKKALQIYQKLLERTRSVALETAAERWLFYDDFVDEKDGWSASFFEKKVQKKTPDLGDRMSDAFEKAFEKEENVPVVIIGSDCFELKKEHLEAAFEALRSNDFVIGPARDGGYFLLGMRRFEPRVFQNIEWSTASVFEKTRQKIVDLGQTLAVLPILPDIDTIEDVLEISELRAFL